MCLVSNYERRENTLDNEAYTCSLIKSCVAGNEDISLLKWVSFLLGHAV